MRDGGRCPLPLSPTPINVAKRVSVRTCDTMLLLLYGWRSVDQWRWRKKEFRRGTASRPPSLELSSQPATTTRRRGRRWNAYLSRLLRCLHPDLSFHISSKAFHPHRHHLTSIGRRYPATASTRRRSASKRRHSTPTTQECTRSLMRMRSRCPPETTCPLRRSAVPVASRWPQLGTVSRVTSCVTYLRQISVLSGDHK